MSIVFPKQVVRVNQMFRRGRTVPKRYLNGGAVEYHAKALELDWSVDCDVLLGILM